MNLRTFSRDAQGSIFIYLLFILVALYAGLLFLPDVFLAPFGTYLKVDERPQKSDAIVVLLGGNGPERIIRAKQLLEMEAAPKIVFGSGYRNPDIYDNLPENFVWPNSSTVYRIALESLGIGEDKFEIVDTKLAYDTSLELTAIGDYGRSKGWKTIMLVTSAPHTRRSSIIWKRVNPDIRAVTSSAWDPGFQNWWKYGHWRRSVGYEYSALLKETWAQVESGLLELIKSNQ